MLDDNKELTQKRQIEWIEIVSNLLNGIIFEYYPNSDVLIYTRDSNCFQNESVVNQFTTLFHQYVHAEDISEYHKLFMQMEKKK